ncbi:hypothetical protein [Nocardiopsis tropica]|uniref:Phytol kinase n=1 Tax=Nocardiopsis tropica TaxID=109330 RepID=A0ABU7KKC9_9ACTN|nr:hypothetical protein [Nocardiopsis umidischolae]MEE2049751.1 hypothetical protein [Nocardiopsis umidischolae]
MESFLIGLGVQLGHVSWLPLAAYLLLSTVVMGNVATYLRTRRGWRDGYTRKFNHFGHAVCAAPTIGFLPEPHLVPTVAVATVGVAVMYGWSALTRLPVIRGIVQGSLRDRDKPHGRFFFFLPLLTGNVAMVLCFALFPAEAARAAILAVAVGDGLAEPVGLRFGSRTTYKVRDLVFRRWNTKSIHGNATVFLAAAGTSTWTLWGAFAPAPLMAVSAVLIFAAAVALVEALSPRGLDNMNIFLGGSLLMTGLIAWLPN